MKRQVHKRCCFLLLILLINEISCVPIFTDESLGSIVISEIDLPTEATVPGEKELIEPEKPESFVELYEKYDNEFIKNATVNPVEDGDNENVENLQQKRSSVIDDESLDDGKSLIEKIQSIVDPEVRKEFEVEITKSGSVVDDEKVDDDVASDYDPNYANKVVTLTEKPLDIDVANVSENSIHDFNADDGEKKMTVHEKEVLQGHLVEQLVHTKDPEMEFTTIIPQDDFTHHDHIKNPEIVEVLEHIVYQSSDVEMSQVTTMDTLNVQVDFDPIEIIPKDRHRFRNVDEDVTTEKNDKFVGFQPAEDLVEAGDETTESDKFFKNVENEDDSAEKTAEVIVETLEFVGMFGKSFKIENADDEAAASQAKTESGSEIEATTVTEETRNFSEFPTSTDAPTTVPSTTTLSPATFESVTEIVETRTEISVNFELADKNSSEESKKHSSSKKSSEESNSSKSSESKDKVEKTSAESSEENNAAEVFDKDELRKLDLGNNKVIQSNQPNNLIADLYKDTLDHEVIKKDHPADLALPYEIMERQFNDIAQDKIQSEDATTVGIYETFEDIVTTVSDGISLSKEFQGAIYSFRDNPEENKTVLDTNSDVVSSKNIKNSLVNIAEGPLTVENHAEAQVEISKASYFFVSIIGFVSVTIILTLYTTLKRRSTRPFLF